MAVVPARVVRLDLEGMTCASCATRIEKKLNKLDGVEATVNFATEQATVHSDRAIPIADLVGAIESAGYGAREVAPAHVHPADEPARVLRRRLAVAIGLTVPVALLAMVPPLQFSGWEWVALALATPVVFWSGIGFHRAALKVARHASASKLCMNTTVAPSRCDVVDHPAGAEWYSGAGHR